MQTIGVAIALPEPWASDLQEYRVDLGDETAYSIPTHITLIPPTEVGDDLTDVVAHLEQVAASQKSFRIHLRGTGTFRPVSPVVFVAVADGIAGCEQLAASVRTGPLQVELEFPFHPHVTVAHHLDEATLDRAYAELASFDCSFEATEFHLYLHDEGSGWVPTRGFHLG
ncbi:2'-5' RNA ligase family protein [Nocardioides jishulii]|uniref:2'-5' RNA ligase family protein n=1 Tax=Nocardioides jishulii TaxID=2575440 RepID=A0A4U2YVL9_9ACTN|nr:2'-5' RNA ligase family protein [Nocardioides jishulii]QCX28315.1 2'-5' RNA ligase family protein [Nocardioides jishulii]TKI64792.1 2'-5' RNA ligase family protein [Nocardioides jishulii]